METKKYYAFISYKREDERWAAWLQNRLEKYNFPTTLNGRTDLPKNIRPVFRDVTDLTPAPLEQVISDALAASEWLVVVCSPRSAQSVWVSKEAQAFIDSGRENRIIPFVIEGSPFSGDPATECYPEALLSLQGKRELLAANVNEAGREAAVIKVVARMFGLGFDVLWQRYERDQRRRRRILLAIGVAFLLVVAGVALWIGLQNRKITAQSHDILIQQEMFYAKQASLLLDEGDTYTALLLLGELTDPEGPFAAVPLQPEAERQMRRALAMRDTAEWQLECVYRSPGEQYNAPQVTPDGKYLLVQAFHDINVYDYKTGKLLRRIVTGVQSEEESNFALYVSQDSRWILSVSYWEEIIKLFDIETGEMLKEKSIRDSNLALSFYDDELCLNKDGFAIVHTDTLLYSPTEDVYYYDKYGEPIKIEQESWKNEEYCIRAFDMRNSEKERGCIFFENSDRTYAIDNGNRYGSRLASINLEGEIVIHDKSTGKLLYKFTPDDDVLIWKYLTDDEVLLIKSNAVYKYNLPQKKMWKVVNRGFDMKRNEWSLQDAQLSKDKFMVFNGDTSFLYDTETCTLDAFYVIDKNKYDRVELSWYDNSLLLRSQEDGTIYRIRHNPKFENNSRYFWYELCLNSNGTPFSSEGCANTKGYFVCNDSLYVGTMDVQVDGVFQGSYFVVQEAASDSVTLMENETQRFMNASHDGGYVILSDGIHGSIFDVRRKKKMSFPDAYRPLFFDYKNNVYCIPTPIQGSDCDRTHPQDSLYKYDIEKDTVGYVMTVPGVVLVDPMSIRMYGDYISSEGYVLCDANAVGGIERMVIDTRNDMIVSKVRIPSVGSAKLTPDGEYVLSTESDGFLRVHRTSDFETIDSSACNMGYITAISPDGQYAIVYNNSSGVSELWGMHPLCLLEKLRLNVPRSVGFAKDGKSIIVNTNRFNENGKMLFVRIPIDSQKDVVEKIRKVVGGRVLSTEEKKLILQ